MVLVTAAAGAVGSVVCQIAKLKGHTVIRTAGGLAKVRYLREELGIDVCFENVGAVHLEAAINVARPFARFALCGAISQYNTMSTPYGVRNLIVAIGKQLRLEGFIVGSHADMNDAFLRDLRGWIAEGKVKWRETVLDGLENAPDAFLGLFSGENLGKALVKLA